MIHIHITVGDSIKCRKAALRPRVTWEDVLTVGLYELEKAMTQPIKVPTRQKGESNGTKR